MNQNNSLWATKGFTDGLQSVRAVKAIKTPQDALLVAKNLSRNFQRDFLKIYDTSVNDSERLLFAAQNRKRIGSYIAKAGAMLEAALDAMPQFQFGTTHYAPSTAGMLAQDGVTLQQTAQSAMLPMYRQIDYQLNRLVEQIQAATAEMGEFSFGQYIPSTRAGGLGSWSVFSQRLDEKIAMGKALQQSKKPPKRIWVVVDHSKGSRNFYAYFYDGREIATELAHSIMEKQDNKG